MLIIKINIMKHGNYEITYNSLKDAIVIKSLTNQTSKLDNFIKFHFPLNKWVKNQVASHNTYGKYIKFYKENLRWRLAYPKYCGDNCRIIFL